MSIYTRVLMVSCALALAGFPSVEAADLELFGGYTLGRIKSDNQANNQTISGWNASATHPITNRFGVTADFAGFYGSIASSGSASADTVNARQYSFMGGPQFRVLRTSRVETSVRAVFGAAYQYVPNATDHAQAQTAFASLVGSNVDFKMSRRVSLRFSPGMYFTRFGTDQTQRNFRFSVGPVFRIGGES